MITLVTGNDGKWNLAVAQLARFGIELRRETFDLPEIQSFDSAEIAAESVKLACARVGGPVMVTDVSYFLKALKDFPGPFARYTNTYLTPGDFLRLMEGKADRRFEIEEVLAYCEPGLEPVVFRSSMFGTIAEVAHGERLMDSLTILDGMEKPLAAYPVEEVRAYWESQLTHFTQLGGVACQTVGGWYTCLLSALFRGKGDIHADIKHYIYNADARDGKAGMR